MDKKNYGILVAPPRPTDYILGGINDISVIRSVENWNQYLPDVESQSNLVTDFLVCVSMSLIHEIEVNLNYLLANNQLSDEAKNFFEDHGYISNGVFKLSVRFNAKLNGTDKTMGQYFNVAADHLRSIDGFIPNGLWPITENMTWDEFYTPVPKELIGLGKKALWFILAQYQWIPSVTSESLKLSPIQVATAVCAGWDSGKTVNKCSSQPIQHATMIYGIDSLGNYQDFDHYPPFKQLLAPDYELPLNMQHVASMKPIVLRIGMHGDNVKALQDNLMRLGYAPFISDGVFGPNTLAAVTKFQARNNLISDGVAGPVTLQTLYTVLNKPTNSKLDLWCEAIKQMEGAKPERCNPGNLRFVGQQYAINDKGFCKFDTYEHGYQALRNQIINACMGKLKAYNSSGNLYDFYNVYAPASDGNNPKNYAEFVAKYMNISPDTVIKTLI